MTITRPSGRFRRRQKRCYELCGKIVLDRPEWTLVHGTVRAVPYDLRYGHAWLEQDETVYDAVLDELFSVADYYRRFEAKPIVKFTAIDAAKAITEYRRWGPLHPSVAERNPALRRSVLLKGAP